jgi:hypothetical protein
MIRAASDLDFEVIDISRSRRNETELAPGVFSSTIACSPTGVLSLLRVGRLHEPLHYYRECITLQVLSGEVAVGCQLSGASAATRTPITGGPGSLVIIPSGVPVEILIEGEFLRFATPLPDPNGPVWLDGPDAMIDTDVPTRAHLPQVVDVARQLSSLQPTVAGFKSIPLFRSQSGGVALERIEETISGSHNGEQRMLSIFRGSAIAKSGRTTTPLTARHVAIFPDDVKYTIERVEEPLEFVAFSSHAHAPG